MFKIIVAYDKNRGIGLNNTLPWKIKADMEYFKNITTLTKNKKKTNVVIMGRKTWLSIPVKFRPLKNRINIILSKTLSDPNLIIMRSIDDVLNYVLTNKKKIESCFVIGGETIYKQFLNENLVSTIYATEIDEIYGCDTFFPIINRFKERVNLPDNGREEHNGFDFVKYLYHNDEEENYLELMQEILNNGIKRSDRTGVGTLSVFGRSLKYNLRDGTLPLLTTKFIPFRIIVEELLWMLSGSTDASKLQEKNIHIWDGNSSRDFLDKRGLNHLPEGDIGSGYGFNLKHFGADYVDCKTDYIGKGFDQVKYVMDLLKNDPTSRRILFSYWNPGNLDTTALLSCHLMYQFYVDTDKNELSACLYQRSSDYFLANNFNAIALCLWVRIFCHLLGFKPGEVTHFFADTHIYLNHIEQCKEQLERKPSVFPKLEIIREISSIEDFKYEDFKLINYYPQSRIKAIMAI